jgi:hypothetical protein
VFHVPCLAGVLIASSFKLGCGLQPLIVTGAAKLLAIAIDLADGTTIDQVCSWALPHILCESRRVLMMLF